MSLSLFAYRSRSSRTRSSALRLSGVVQGASVGLRGVVTHSVRSRIGSVYSTSAYGVPREGMP